MPTRFSAQISDELAAEVRELIDNVRASPEPESHRAAGLDLVLRLTRANLDDYFLRSVRELELGMIAESATKIGLQAAFTGISVFVRRLAGKLSAEQMRRLADILEARLVAG